MEAYTELTFHGSGKLLALTDAPVVITQSKLFKAADGSIYAALALKSLSEKKIIAVKAEIEPRDIEGNPLGDAVEYSYLDLSVLKNVTFGADVFIPLPDANTRDYTAKLTLAVFGDMSKWVNETPFEEIDVQKPLLEALLTGELVEVYRDETTPAAARVPDTWENLWRCTCGGVNLQEETACTACGAARETVFAALDPEQLAEKKAVADALAAEAAQELAEQRAEHRAKTRKGLWLFLATVALTLVLALVGGTVTAGRITKERKAELQEYLLQDNLYACVDMLYQAGDKKLWKDASADLCAYINQTYKEKIREGTISNIEVDRYYGDYYTKITYTVTMDYGDAIGSFKIVTTNDGESYGLYF
ncbi:MAG: hypothetical protein IJK64_02110 [Clostridia bacterium]|nr:hypothetical protein [Clostridia bacterium]